MKAKLLAIVALALLLSLGLAQIAQAATPIYVRPGGDDTACNGTVDVDYSEGVAPNCAVKTIQKGIDLVDAGGTVYVGTGTYILAAQVNVTKANITLDGDGPGSTIVQISGTGYGFYITASGVTLQDFEIQKTDSINQNLIYIGASSVSIKDNTMWGQYVLGGGETTRAFEVAYGSAGLLIEGNTIHNLRQPGYFNGSVASPTTGNITNNDIYVTRGWVMAGANMTYTGNTWGTGTNANYLDIVILSGTDPSYYPDIVAVSDANNNAVVEDQRPATDVLSDVFVDDTAAAGGDGTVTKPYQTISPAITRVVAKGTIYVAAGTYAENLTVYDKHMHFVGAVDGNGNPLPTIVGTLSIDHPGSGDALRRIENINFVVNTGNCLDLKNVDLGVTIKNCTFDGAGLFLLNGKNGVNILSGPNGNNNVTIDDCTFQNGLYVSVNAYANYLTVKDSTFVNVKGGINHQGGGGNLVVQDTDISVIAQAADADTYGVRFGPSSGSIQNMTIAGGSISVDKNGLVADPGTYHSALIVRAAASGTLAANGISIDGDVVNLSTTSLDATCNYWQTIVMSEIAAKITGLVEWSPWADDLMACTYTWPVHNITQGTDYQTIMAAITAANAGDEIHVDAGTYAEDVVVNKAVKLVGVPGGASAGPGPGAPVIDGGASGVVVDITANGVIFEGFTVQNSGMTAADAGIRLYGVSGCTVNDNAVTGNAIGIGLLMASGNSVSRNTVTSNAAYGIAIVAGDGNTIDLNSVTGNAAHAIALENAAMVGGDLADGATGTLIKGNAISGNVDGIFLGENCDSNQVTDGNQISGATGVGVSFWRSDGHTVTDNVISSFPIGIRLLGSSNNTIARNYVTGNAEGIKVDASWQIGVWYQSANNTISGNDLSANTTAVLCGAEQTAVVNASGNWWGSAVPATVKAAANGGSIVDYTPWLASGADMGDLGFQGDFSTLWVDDDSPQTGTTGRIQEGIDLVSGSTVYVAAGTYVEDPVIDKAVTLLGPNAAINPNTGARVPEAVIRGATPSGLSDFLELDAENVVIRGFTFDNLRIDNYNNTVGTNTNLIGGVVLENNIFSNVLGTAIYLRDGRNAPGLYSTGVSIQNNQIIAPGSAGSADYNAGTGILLLGAEASTISGNVISSAAYNGIQLGRCKDMSIAGNTATGAAQPALQIAQWNAGTFTISDNIFSTLSTTKAAVRLYAFTNNYYPVFNLSGNTIQDSQYGVQIGHGDAGKGYNDIRDADYSFSGNTFANIGTYRLVVYLATEATPAEITEMDALFAQVYYPGDRAQLITAADPFTYVVFHPLCSTDCYVAKTGNDSASGNSYDPFLTIQKGIDTVSSAGTVHVAAGTYDEALNIEGRADLNIVGADRTTTIVRSSTTLPWNVGSYGTSRRAMVRVVSSTDIDFSNLTFDCDLIKGNDITGVLYWDSTGTLNNNIIKNMSASDAAGFYNEIGSYVRAPSYPAGARAQVTFQNNTFINAGRVGIVTHDYVNLVASGNTFYKDIADFGYAMEIGSESTAQVSGNTIYGYDTTASDLSESGGIYVENSFTGPVFGPPVTGVTKNVSITGNIIYDCQWAVTIGNEWDGYAGDVDIVATISGNNFHDNLIGAIKIADEDKEYGSSVTVTASGNTLTNNGDYGYYISTDGDGNITANLSGETITGHGTGIHLADTGAPSTSSYVIEVHSSTISGNTNYGLNNTISGLLVDAEDNWWGSANGPAHVSNTFNIGAQGNPVSNGVTFVSWLNAAPPAGVSFAPVTTTDPVGEYASIQAGVDASNPGGTVNAAAGTFTEQVNIGKNLTLQGVGPTTIIASPATLAPYTIGGTPRRPIVYVHGAAVTVQQLAVDGNGLGNANSGFMGIAYHNAAGTVDDVTISEIRDTPFSGAQHGVGLYARIEDSVARTLNVTDVTITDFQKNGMALIGSGLTANVSSCTVTGAGPTTVNGQNGIQISDGAGGSVEDCDVSGIAWIGTGWIACGMLFLEGATVDVSGGSILDSQVGIRYSDNSGSVEGLTFVAADIENVEGISVLDYGAGVLTEGGQSPLPASPVDGGAFTKGAGTDGTVTSITIDSVDLTGTHSTRDDDYGIDVWGMGDAVDVSVTNSSLQEWSIAILAYDYSSAVDVTAHQNCIESNDWGFYAYTAAVQDAEINWWGDASGPYHDISNPSGLGNGATDNVDFEPWITDGCGGTATGANWQNTRTLAIDDLQGSLDDALSGDTIIPIGTSPLGGGGIANVAGVTIDLSGKTVGPGSPAFTINADDITVKGPGILDGNGSTDPAILVNAGAGNFILDGVQVTGWANGIELAGDVTSFKVVSNWIHSNTGHGLLVDADVDLYGIVTIEGNLFKVNGGNGIQHNGNGTLPAEYNSWGDIGGYATGDGIGGLVDADPFTYVESFFDVWPDALALERHVPEGTSFDVALKADAVNVAAISFGFTYDSSVLTLNSATFASPWVTGSSFCVNLSTMGNVKYVCALLGSEWTATAGTIATFNFTAPTLMDDNPVTTYLNLSHLEADTSAAAIGGQKVFVNNAGFNLPSATARDITDTDDGRIIIERLANYTGLVDLQGRVNDSGATVEVHATSIFASTLLAQATSNSSGAYTTIHIAGNWLGIGSTYWFQVDRALYLPTTVLAPTPAANYAHSKILTFPLTTLAKVLLLGGDATDDNDILINDVSCIGGSYGGAVVVCGFAGSSDVNGDGKVNVQDLSMAGGNLYKTSSPWTP